METFYKTAFDVRSENVDYLSNNGTTHDTFIDLRAIVTKYKKDELIDPIQMGDRQVFILAEEVTTLLIPTPKIGDRIIFRGSHLGVITVDDSTRTNRGDVIAYVIQVRG